MLKIFAKSALSYYQLKQFSSALTAIDPAINAVSARFVHFVDAAKTLSEQELEQLTQLTDYGYPLADLAQGQLFLVVPRLGTLSPWSSKASEIIKRCGITAVNRIERGVEYRIASSNKISTVVSRKIEPLIHDRMTQMVYTDWDKLDLFTAHKPQPLLTVPVCEQGRKALVAINKQLGLALSAAEIDYLTHNFKQLQRNPSDAELMMFAQANSEHCRHKIFNADWTIDGKQQTTSLFAMIRHTAAQSPAGILSAYHDNAAVIAGHTVAVLHRDPQSGAYTYLEEPAHLVMKVETHNHPTAISPYPGAATGSGGEIRDEAATGRGAASKAGLVGFSVSHLKIPDFAQPWETDNGKPEHIASALDIMLEAPIGGATFNNEFGRPTIAGYFRSFEQKTSNKNEYSGYHKPIMLAGGMGNIRPMLVAKHKIPAGSLIIVLGGPAMLIGLGGGAASSQTSREGVAQLDFASVQRENPQIQRRCQEVINHCNAMGDNTPIISIHDVGAGGLSNAVPEIIHDCQQGGSFKLRAIPSADNSMSPMQLWCNEAQERYVLAIAPSALDLFATFCEREHCLYSVIGEVSDAQQLTVSDAQLGGNPIAIPMALLFGKSPKIKQDVARKNPALTALDLAPVDLATAVNRVLAFPAVADKSFLIHIGDRSVTGLVARDQMVGRWQVPVADVAVTAAGFHSFSGEAMALGERAPLALIDASAAARMAIAEALTNLAAARIESLPKIKLSANWMAACGSEGEDAALFDAVKAVSMEVCPALGIAIPVGKDSLSMQTAWRDKGENKVVKSPLSLVVTAFAPVLDIKKTLTPELKAEASALILLDLGGRKNRLGGSVLAQTYNQLGDEAPDLDATDLLKKFFNAVQTLNAQNQLLAYHDRSDGGLVATLAEMIFAGRQGINLVMDDLFADQQRITEHSLLAALFNEELGAVIQVKQAEHYKVLRLLFDAGLQGYVFSIGKTTNKQQLTITCQTKIHYSASRASLQKTWSEMSYRMQCLRDHRVCAEQQFERISDDHDPGLFASLSFAVNDPINPQFKRSKRPKIAILREQGVNGHLEMAAAFEYAGFNAIDLHMSDIIQTRVSLDDFVGLAASGGFSYGDVFGAGSGWANSILLNPRARAQFAAFFQREDTFGLGVCNGCQMLTGLKSIIPGAQHWPTFKRNISEQFEARVSMVKIQQSPSVLLQDMAGSLLPVVSAHGEGRTDFATSDDQRYAQIALTYVDNYGKPAPTFPANPSGAFLGITGLTNNDGRFTIMMPHPERCFRAIQNSWSPADWETDGGWMRLFRNARAWVG